MSQWKQFTSSFTVPQTISEKVWTNFIARTFQKVIDKTMTDRTAQAQKQLKFQEAVLKSFNL